MIRRGTDVRLRGGAAGRICGAGWRRWIAGRAAAPVERGGSVRTFHVNTATTASGCEALVRNVSRDTTLYTYESRLCTATGKEYAGHRTVKHREEIRPPRRRCCGAHQRD